jgi:hypothetical protein
MQNALTLGALVAFHSVLELCFSRFATSSDKYNVLQGAVVASHRIFKRWTCHRDHHAGQPLKRARAKDASNSKTFGLLQRRRLGFERRVVQSRSGQSVAWSGTPVQARRRSRTC